MRWLLDGPLAAWDCETTGVNVEQDRVVTACVATLQPGTPWAVDSWSTLIDPGIDIPEGATAVHGITTEQARKNGIAPVDGLNEIAYRLARLHLAGIPVIGANLAYDLTLLDRELRRWDLPTLDGRDAPPRPIVDVMVIDRWLDPYRPGGRKLTDLCQWYGVRIDGAHDSSADALAAARVAYRLALRSQEDPAELRRLYAGFGRRNPGDIADRFDQLAEMNPADLHDAQVIWRQEQMASLQEFHRRKGKTSGDYNGAWPMIPYQPQPMAEQSELPL